jgi:ribosomal-protein-alanine N-acetyltransferase
MQLTTKRLCLRPIRVLDAEALFAARGDDEVMRWWDWPAQKSVAEVEAVFRANIPEPGEGNTLWWAAALDACGPAIGECDLSEIDRHHRRAEVGFLFARAHWGNGFAQEAVQAVIDFAFGPLDLERLSAQCHVGNESSVRLLERLGFVCEGRLKSHTVRDGERRDCLVYGLIRDSRA